MAGHIDVDNSLEERRSLLGTVFHNVENVILDNNFQPSLSSKSMIPSTTKGHLSLTTTPALLELRQNNPQDCSNLITASVNRATVEISRTIIALNATFSQQLQQASISASNGIKSAQDSATSTIAVVVQSASIATSSAFSSLTIANLAVTSVNFALTSVQASASTAIASASSNLDLAQSTITSVNLALSSVSSASSTDVSSLSASLALLQASISSIQASASDAIAAAQAALASATGSAAAQASSILASAASNGQALSSQTSSSQPIFHAPPTTFLTPAQLAAIIVGAVVGSILFGLALYFLIIRMKNRKDRDSYLDEKDVARSPRNIPTRMSSTFRTGNAMTIKFNPPKTSDAPPPAQPSIREPTFKASPSAEIQEISDVSPARGVAWPLTLSFTAKEDDPFQDPTEEVTGWPLMAGGINTVVTTPSTWAAPRKRSVDIFEAARLSFIAPVPDPVPYMGPFADPVVDERGQSMAGNTSFANVTPREEVINPFEDPVEETFLVEEFRARASEDVQPTFPLPNTVPIQQEPSRPSLDIEEPPSPARVLIQESQTQQSPSPPSSPALQQTLNTATPEPINPPIPSPHLPTPSITSLATLLPPQSTRAPLASTLALLRSEPEPERNSTMPEIDILLRQVAQQNEKLAYKPLFWTDFRAAEPDVPVDLGGFEVEEVRMLSLFKGYGGFEEEFWG
ncbi:uncharacterized protein LY89DRAFT_151776 [Mollisia scopiformis]|uniref:Uncharacterized protein n=1 Tax=Mollisia scopiformis TaxID=149040 RepID=A0A194X1X8_MOLSC|nr:uncharacterized protein LY89DRAFT_151776 [Mollisia scopiformis]KUJ13994.1 hypothetical protein LY89DRAFT_151776 [Mollisia scopiformis]